MNTEEIKSIVDEFRACAGMYERNEQLYKIHEGALLPYVLDDLQKQLSPKSFEQVKYRMAPINVLKRLIDKLSKIYAEAPMRVVTPESEGSQEALSQYEKSFDINVQMSLANRFFNLHKGVFVEPYLDKGQPRLRIIPFDRFFVKSEDPVNPLRVTHYLKCMGAYEAEVGGGKEEIYYLYTDNEFLIINDQGEIRRDLMIERGNPEGINVYGKIPGVYIQRSMIDLIPEPDTDTLCMTKLFPILLSDLNFAIMYQSFSIIYGIDVDLENLTMSPNALWSIKTDKNAGEKAAQLGSIKPSVDLDAVTRYIMTLLSAWMTTRNIRPGSGIGNLTPDNAASGISKAIDEMDTSEDRSEQIPYFIKGEKEIWELVIDYMIPVWANQPDFQLPIIPVNSEVTTIFPEQEPMIDEATRIANVKTKIELKLETRRGALMELDPDMGAKELDAKIIELDAEYKIQEPVENKPGLPAEFADEANDE